MRRGYGKVHAGCCTDEQDGRKKGEREGGSEKVRKERKKILAVLIISPAD